MATVTTSSGHHLTVIETVEEVFQLMHDTYPQQFINLHERKNLPPSPEFDVWVKNDDVSVVKP